MASQITSHEIIRPDPSLGYITSAPVCLPAAIPFSINALLLISFFTYGAGALLIVTLLAVSERPGNAAFYWSLAGVFTTLLGFAAGMFSVFRLFQRRYRQGTPTKITALVCCLINAAQAIFCATYLHW